MRGAGSVPMVWGRSSPPEEDTIMTSHQIDPDAEPTSWLRERGAGLVEYALVVALIAVVAISAVSALGGSTSGVLADGSDGIGNAPTTTTTEAALNCAATHADGYATGEGYPTPCYSPTAGPYFP